MLGTVTSLFGVCVCVTNPDTMCMNPTYTTQQTRQKQMKLCNLGIGVRTVWDGCVQNSKTLSLSSIFLA